MYHMIFHLEERIIVLLLTSNQLIILVFALIVELINCCYHNILYHHYRFEICLILCDWKAFTAIEDELHDFEFNKLSAVDYYFCSLPTKQ